MLAIGGILQFIFPLASPFDTTPSFELPEAIAVGGTPTSPPAPEPTNHQPPNPPPLYHQHSSPNQPLPTPNAKFHLEQGDDYYEKGDYDTAIAEYNQAIRIEPDNAKAYFRRGDAYYDEKGNYEQAIADYTESIHLDPNYAKAYHYRGITYDKQGRLNTHLVRNGNFQTIPSPRVAAIYGRTLVTCDELLRGNWVDWTKPLIRIAFYLPLCFVSVIIPVMSMKITKNMCIYTNPYIFTFQRRKKLCLFPTTFRK